MSGRILHACPRCGRATQTRGRCNTCPPTRRQLTTTQRGYGKTHRAKANQLKPAAIGTPCPICGETMLPGQALSLDHTLPLSLDGRTGDRPGDRIVHAKCNSRRGNRT